MRGGGDVVDIVPVDVGFTAVETEPQGAIHILVAKEVAPLDTGFVVGVAKNGEGGNIKIGNGGAPTINPADASSVISAEKVSTEKGAVPTPLATEEAYSSPIISVSGGAGSGSKGRTDRRGRLFSRRGGQEQEGTPGTDRRGRAVQYGEKVYRQVYFL